jgi:hypothetical protein
MPIPKLSIDDYQEMDYCSQGVCKACGAINGDCEPDAEDYPCDDCGENQVVGAQNALIEGMFE